MNSQAAFSIEPASLNDLDDMLAIEEASFTSPWTRQMYEVELGRNPFSRTLAARAEDGTLIGYVVVWVVFEELRLMTLAVHPAHRRRGMASALLAAGLALGRREGAQRAHLEVRASNEAALALYGKAGFRREGMRAGYYKDPVEDAVLMHLDPLSDLP
jgi:ribosomal-protein-alanine N-acetyltransferase